VMDAEQERILGLPGEAQGEHRAHWIAHLAMLATTRGRDQFAVRPGDACAIRTTLLRSPARQRRRARVGTIASGGVRTLPNTRGANGAHAARQAHARAKRCLLDRAPYPATTPWRSTRTRLRGSCRAVAPARVIACPRETR